MTDTNTPTDPEEIRANIERTRGELGSDVDALADKVRPSSIVDRQANKIKSAAGSVRDRVMGVADSARESADSGASSVGHAIADAPKAAVHKAEGHPLAVGLIAFGVGLLASSLIPSSSKERQLADTAKENLGPIKDTLSDAAKEVAENLKEPAADAVASIKESASDAVDSVKGEASGAADTVKESASSAREGVTG